MPHFTTETPIGDFICQREEDVLGYYDFPLMWLADGPDGRFLITCMEDEPGHKLLIFWAIPVNPTEAVDLSKNRHLPHLPMPDEQLALLRQAGWFYEIREFHDGKEWQIACTRRDAQSLSDEERGWFE